MSTVANKVYASFEERRAAMEAEKKANEKLALDVFLNCRYTSSITDKLRNLHFTDMGRERLAHTAGVIWAMNAAGRVDVATKMAVDLWEMLTRLNEYGGMLEFEYRGAKFSVPAFRVSLSDDGTLGGFGLLWCRAIDPNNTTIDRSKVRPELKTVRGARVDGDDSKEWIRTDIDYTYSFNGGLLYHGPCGDDVFAVTLDGRSRWWSTHT